MAKQLFIRKYRWTSGVALLILLSVITAILSQAKWKNELGYAFTDAKGYYSYLPAAFIHHSFALDTEEKVKYASFKKTDDGKPFIKYTMGNAFCYLPGFLMAHGVASISSYESNGYTLPYQIAFITTALLFLFLSLRLAVKILSRFYDDKTIALTFFLVFLGTNYFHYATSYLSYSHIYSFYFILLFLERSWRVLERFTWKNSLYAGLAFGMMTLIRPVDGVFLIFPIIYGVSNIDTFKKRINYILSHIPQVLFFLLTAVIVWVPQLMYNYSVFEKITINSYKGEKFYFLDPEIWNALFSFNNGWLIYTPLMIFGIIGCFILLKKKEYSWLILTLIYIYVISSWWCWWYVGFGNRAFVNLSAFLLLPLSSCIAYIRSRKRLYYPFFILLLLGVVLNQFQTYQFEKDALRYEAMTPESYLHSFGTLHPTFEFFDLLEKYDTQYAKEGKNVLHVWNYDTLAVLTPSELQGAELGNQDMYKGSFKFKIPEANSFIICAESDETLENLSLYLKLLDSTGQVKDGYGKVNTKSLGNARIQQRMYYRFRYGVNEKDSLQFFFFNKKLEEGKVHELKIYALHAKDSLVFEESVDE
ncbi:hypothetical protein [Lishizhenia sp.]|uniref:hypothetical protein n=1 Tax=Lishizhenia sp. TaxID=2497594 RepID=UPI00299D532B|nr:hypothetical protein [Lishizhenia sp.]MDX1444835.1 hypothetical protein [Lishizhenia sp.]